MQISTVELIMAKGKGKSVHGKSDGAGFGDMLEDFEQKGESAKLLAMLGFALEAQPVSADMPAAQTGAECSASVPAGAADSVSAPVYTLLQSGMSAQGLLTPHQAAKTPQPAAAPDLGTGGTISAARSDFFTAAMRHAAAGQPASEPSSFSAAFSHLRVGAVPDKAIPVPQKKDPDAAALVPQEGKQSKEPLFSRLMQKDVQNIQSVQHNPAKSAETVQVMPAAKQAEAPLPAHVTQAAVQGAQPQRQNAEIPIADTRTVPETKQAEAPLPVHVAQTAVQGAQPRRQNAESPAGDTRTLPAAKQAEAPSFLQPAQKAPLNQEPAQADTRSPDSIQATVRQWSTAQPAYAAEARSALQMTRQENSADTKPSVTVNPGIKAQDSESPAPKPSVSADSFFTQVGERTLPVRASGQEADAAAPVTRLSQSMHEKTATVRAAALSAKKSGGDQDAAGSPENTGDAQTAQAVFSVPKTGDVHPRTDIRAADGAGVTDQVANAVLKAAEEGRTEVRLHLSPEDLGGISVRIVSQGGMLSLHITADSQQTGQLLAQNMHELTKSLSDGGITMAKADVTSTGFSAFDAATSQQRQQQSFDRRHDGNLPKWISAIHTQGPVQSAAAAPVSRPSTITAPAGLSILV